MQLYPRKMQWNDLGQEFTWVMCEFGATVTTELI